MVTNEKVNKYRHNGWFREFKPGHDRELFLNNLPTNIITFSLTYNVRLRLLLLHVPTTPSSLFVELRLTPSFLFSPEDPLHYELFIIRCRSEVGELYLLVYIINRLRGQEKFTWVVNLRYPQDHFHCGTSTGRNYEASKSFDTLNLNGRFTCLTDL